MAHKTNNFERFWRELKRRKVVHVIAVYAATAFVILELASMVARPLKLPEWTESIVIVLLCIGFIIAVFVSWVYDITPAGVKKTKPASTSKHTDHPTTQISNGWKIATYVSAIIIVAFVAFNFLTKRNFNADISKLDNSIAVLPFENYSPDTTNLYFCDGMMDEILTQLQKIGSLKVKSRTSGERYRHPDKDIRDIGRELGVSFIVEGSVRKAGNDLRITVQLINAKTGDHLWAEPYDGKYTDKIFEFQTNVAKRVAASLNEVLTTEEKQRIAKKPTANLAAYDLYLKANNYLKEYEKNRDLSSYYTAVNLYNEALKIDSSFAKTYIGLANAYYYRYQWETYFKENYLDSMLVLADHALSIDDQLEGAFYIKGIYYYENGKFQEALDNFDEALIINPNYYPAYKEKGYILSWLSIDFVKCIENWQKALELISGNERPDVLRKLGSAYLEVGFFDRAKYYINEAFTLDSNKVANLGDLIYLALYQENFEEGLNLERKGLEIYSDSNLTSVVLMMLGNKEEAYSIATKKVEYYKKSNVPNLQESHRIGYAFSRMGKHEEAEYYFNQQIKFSQESISLDKKLSKSYAAQYDLAATYAFLGNKGNAYKYLDEFSKKNSFPLWCMLYMKYDPLFDKIRNEVRFQKILQSMEAKYQTEHERVRKRIEEQGML